MVYKYGIDFGTTNSSIALRFLDETDDMEHTLVFQVRDENPNEIIPSVILIGDDGKISVGDAALRMYKTKSNDSEFSSSHKLIRKIKMSLEESGYEFTSTIGDKVFSCDELIAALLRELRIKAEKFIKEIDCEVHGVVMGVPVQYGDIQKNILKKALFKAGFYKDEKEANSLTEFVSEPVAVAVHYGLNLEHNKNVMVFDFGGGTLDIVIMNLKKQIGNDKLHPHETIKKARITLGGEDINKDFFTRCLCNRSKYGLKFLNDVLANGRNLSPIKLWEYICERPEYSGLIKKLEECKWDLSSNSRTRFSYNENDCMIPEKTIYVDEFKAAISDSLDIIETLVDDTIKDCIASKKIEDKYDIDYVIVAGGSSLIPAVQEILIDRFGRQKVIAKAFNDDEVINKLKRNTIKESEVLTSIVRGLAAVGCKEESSVEDVVDTDYGVWDDDENGFIPIIELGSKISNLMLDKLTLKGKYEEVKCTDITANNVDVKIYQRNIAGSQKLGTISIRNPGGKQYRIYMHIDPKSGTLIVNFYDVINSRWMDDISLDERQYEIK